MALSSFTDLLKNLPSNVTIEPTAEKDLAKLLKKNFKEFQQIFADVARLGKGTLPPAGRKKLKSLDAWQFDVGRFRVAYKPAGGHYYILGIFPKSQQTRRLRSI